MLSGSGYCCKTLTMRSATLRVVALELMSASKGERTMQGGKAAKTSKCKTNNKRKIQCIKSMSYLCCSGVRHDVTYGHSNTDVSATHARRDIVPTEHGFEFANLHCSGTHDVQINVDV